MVNVIAYDGGKNSFQFCISRDLPKPKLISFIYEKLRVSDGENYLIIRTDNTPVDSKCIVYFNYHIWLRIPMELKEGYDIVIQKQDVEHTDSADVAYNVSSAVDFMNDSRKVVEFRIGRTTFFIDRENRKITFVVPKNYTVNC